MNDIQNIIIDLFIEFKSICDKLGLNWYLVNGSALGAVKYNGFISWDDDMDIGMPRKDYEIFINKAHEMLPEHIFVQNYRTDKNFPHIYTKLRNSNTAFIERSIKHLDMNHGIYLDIFPLDEYPEDKTEQERLRKREKLLYWKIICAIDDKSKFKIRFRNAVFRALGFKRRTAESIHKLNVLISGYKESGLICNHEDRMSSKRVILKEIYGKGKKAVFEGIEVNIPEKYDEYLTLKYGDWRKEPPKEKQKSHHKADICDANRSYNGYR